MSVGEADQEDDVVLETFGLVNGGELDGVGLGLDAALAGLAVEQDNLREKILRLVEALGEADERF